VKVLLAGPDYEENLSIRYPSASLLMAGHDTVMAAFNSATDATAVADAARRADMVGLSMCFQSRAKEFLRLAQLIKSSNPKKLIVAGGHYASCAAEPLLARHPEIDIIVIHEGEGTLVEIADAMSHLEKRLPQIAGIAYRDGHEVRFTNARRTLDDLDTLPFPDRRGPIHMIAGVPTSYMMGSRGCYGSCAYCCITTLHRMAPGKRFRQRNVERIADEMAALYHERGTRQYVFHDDNFLVPSEAINHVRLSAFEKALKNRGVEDIALVIKCRPADAKWKILRRLKDLGLVRVFLGVESATAHGLSSLDRSQSVEDSERALETCSALGISAQFTLMIFNPDATLDTLRSDVAFMRRFCGNPLNFCRAEIYTGTPLERRMIELGRARGDYLAREYNLSDPVADRACTLALDLFDSRCWSDGSLMQNAIGLDHTAAVAKRFYAGPDRVAACEQVANWLRSVNLDTVNLLDEVIELSASIAGSKDAGLEEAIFDVRERESKTRLRLLSEGSKLRTELEMLRFPGNVRRSDHVSTPSLRLARRVAAAVLAMGIPAATGCGHAQDKDAKTPPPASPPTRYYGISEMAASPLRGGHTQPPVTPGHSDLCSLAGTITDSIRTAVAHVKITITNLDTGVARTLTSNAAGQYAADDLQSGRYSVKAEIKDHETTIVEDIVLKAGEHKRTDIRLVGGANYGGCCEYAASPLKSLDEESLRNLERPAVSAGQQAASPEAKTQPPAPTAAQEALCSLAGIVTDPQGAAVRNATITITNADTKQTRTLTTNDAGQYEANDLHIGRYLLTVLATGFSGAVKNDIVLKAGDRQRADVVLQVYDPGCCEYAALPLKAQAEVDWIAKRKPFTYVVGDAQDHNSFQGIAKLVYGDRKMWVQIFEANRDVVEKPGFIPYGKSILVPPTKRAAPKPLSKVMPVFPPEARREQVWGDVVMDVTLNEDGSVEQVDIIDGPALLVEAATTAVKQWRYHPLRVKGKPVLKFVVVVSFAKGGKIK
jgi:TonB family protein